MRCTARHSEAALYTPEIQGCRFTLAPNLARQQGESGHTHHMNESPGRPSPLLRRNKTLANPSSAGAGRRSTADLCLRPTIVNSKKTCKLRIKPTVSYETSLETDCRKDRARGVGQRSWQENQIKLRQMRESRHV